jgi:hypothetical protein
MAGLLAYQKEALDLPGVDISSPFSVGLGERKHITL